MGKTIRNKKGQYAGSIGDGKTPPFSPTVSSSAKTVEREASPVSTVESVWEAYQSGLAGPHPFEVWEREPTFGICGQCGKNPQHEIHDTRPTDTADITRSPRYAPYADAVWNWTLAHGGISHSMGGTGYRQSVVARMHIEVCGINKNVSTPPQMSEQGEFAGTGEPYNIVEVSAATITCNCRFINRQTWIVAGEKSVNEIVFDVVNAGDTTQENIPEPGPLSEAPVASWWREEWLNTVADEDRDYAENVVVPALWKAHYAQKNIDPLGGRWFGRSEEDFQKIVWELTLQDLATDRPPRGYDIPRYRQLLAPWKGIPESGLDYGTMRKFQLS